MFRTLSTSSAASTKHQNDDENSPSAKNPLLKTVFLSRIVHYSSTNIYEMGKLAFVCQNWKESLQYYCCDTWDRIFKQHLIDSNRYSEKNNRACFYNFLCDEIIANKLSFLVSPLCNCGTGPNDGGLLGASALLCAASVGSLPIMMELVERGASILEERNFFGAHALHCAARKGSLECVKFIFNQLVLFVKNTTNDNSLSSDEKFSTNEKRQKIAEQYVNEMTKHSHTSLYVSIADNHTNVALFLMDPVVSASSYYPSYLTCKISNGGKSEPMSTIHAAVRKNNIQIVKKILEKDPNMIQHTQLDKKLPIETAVVSASRDCFEFLVKFLSSSSSLSLLEQQLKEGAIFAIAEKFRIDMLEWLLEFMMMNGNTNNNTTDEMKTKIKFLLFEHRLTQTLIVKQEKRTVHGLTFDETFKQKVPMSESDKSKKEKMLQLISKFR